MTALSDSISQNPYQDANLPLEERIDNLLSLMTLAEKIGQMTQVEKNSIDVSDISALGIGSILSGGGGYPVPNDNENWYDMVHTFKSAAMQSRLGIPLMYGVDAVHGHNNLIGATIFPQNNGLGATGNPDLVRQIGRATAKEMAATCVRWNFAPAVSIPRDLRWGRSYEGYSEESDVVTEFAVAYVEGLHGDDPKQSTSVLSTAKHYIADGATYWGSSTRLEGLLDVNDDQTLANAGVDEGMLALLRKGAWKLDQGISDIDEETLRSVDLPPYIATMAAGTRCVMASYSMWDGHKMHAHYYLLTEVLKGELGFTGFVVSDWEAIDQIDEDFYKSVVASINAGMDMIMVPFKYHRFIETLTQAVENGDVPISRIDDATRRILRIKLEMGLFETPIVTDVPLSTTGNDEHRALAREAVAQSLVLLQHENDALPLPKADATLIVAGAGADSIGYQCGGWTIEWMGTTDNQMPGTSIWQGIQTQIGDSVEAVYEPAGSGTHRADYGLVVLAEEPYAEGMGDRISLDLSEEEVALVARMRERCDKLTVVVLAGRPLIITEIMPLADAVVMAWWPGSEGNGITDVLYGDKPFTGKLTYTWPRSMAQIPRSADDGQPPLFPYGHGLTL